MKGARGMLIPHGCFGCRTANGRYIPQPPSEGGGKIRALNKKKDSQFLANPLSCGERGIRTPGTSQYNGFQDRRDRPLCHLSKTSFQKCSFSKAMQRYDFFLNLQAFLKFFFVFALFSCCGVNFLGSNPFLQEKTNPLY